MKKVSLLSVIAVCLFASCVNAQESLEKKKILIVYYSHSGNTQEIAKQIQELTQGDIFEIVPVEAYPKDQQQCIDKAREEISANLKPALKEKPENIAEYDVIFVGSPNWYSTISLPVMSFLSENDLSGKTVVPFVTHGSGGKANCFTDMEKLCPKSTILEGLALPGLNAKEAKNDVENWLRKIGIM